MLHGKVFTYVPDDDVENSCQCHAAGQHGGELLGIRRLRLDGDGACCCVGVVEEEGVMVKGR